jgi:hypothetical protein
MIKLRSFLGFEAVAFIMLAVVTAFALSACAGGSSDLLAGVPPVEAKPIRDNVIVPGHRVGPVSLGMDMSALYAEMGSPVNTVTGDLANIYKYPGLEIWVAHRENKVTSIIITGAGYSTAQGVRVGAPELEVRAKYGRPAKFHSDGATSSSCYVQGLGFWFSNGSTVSIDVLAPGCS